MDLDESMIMRKIMDNIIEKGRKVAKGRINGEKGIINKFSFMQKRTTE